MVPIAFITKKGYIDFYNSRNKNNPGLVVNLCPFINHEIYIGENPHIVLSDIAILYQHSMLNFRTKVHNI